MDMNSIIDILFIGSGFYLIVSALRAKKNQTITADVMLGKNTEEKQVTDKPGYIEYMYKRVLVAGVLVIIAGIMNLVNEAFLFSNLITGIANIVVIAALVLYVVAYKKGQKQYMTMQKKEKKQKKSDKIQ